MADKKIFIKQVRSSIDCLENQKRTIKALGLGRPNYVALHNDTPAIRGMIKVVQHLVEVQDAKEA